MARFRGEATGCLIDSRRRLLVRGHDRSAPRGFASARMRGAGRLATGSHSEALGDYGAAYLKTRATLGLGTQARALCVA